MLFLLTVKRQIYCRRYSTSGLSASTPLPTNHLVARPKRDMLAAHERKVGVPVDIIGLLRARRSIRAFQPRPVEPELLRQLLVAAMAAPSACNSQPWEFVVVTQPEIMDRFREKLLSARYNAPAAIAVCGNPSIAHSSVAKKVLLGAGLQRGN